MNTVGVVGVGLIGGSFALALRKAGFTGRIVGVSSPVATKAALERGVIEEAVTLEQATAVSDLLYLAQPIERILQTIEALNVRPDTLVTDAGSTKLAITERARRIPRFVGGHPMAGKETRGVEEADADLFRGRPYVLTCRDTELESWIEKVGARLVFLDPAEHDRLVAVTSHLPQLLSTALASMIGADAAQVAGPAALDMTRLAMSPYEIWRDIFSTNAAPIDAAIAAFIDRLEALRTALPKPEMRLEFEKAAQAARALRTTAP